jgi:hypothetical protein
MELPASSERVAIAELQRILLEWDRTRLLDLRTLDVEILAASLRALDTLRNDWGNWTYDHRINELVFQNPDTEFTFMEAVTDMQAILKEVAEIRAPVEEEE